MARRKFVPSLSSSVNTFIVTNLRVFLDHHRNHCNTCKVFGPDGLKCIMWNFYYDSNNLCETYDCPNIAKSIDGILQYIPPYEIKYQISKYLADESVYRYMYVFYNFQLSSNVTIGFEIMAQLEKDFSRSTIKKLLKRYRVSVTKYCPYDGSWYQPRGNGNNLSDMNKCIKNVYSKFLNIYLPFSWCLIVLDLRDVYPTDETLELVGKHCHYLREIRNIRLLTFTLDGLKKLLFVDNECTIKRNICGTLQQVWALLMISRHTTNIEMKVIVDKLTFILKTCENLFTIQKDHNDPKMLNSIYRAHGYIHQKIEAVIFEESSREELQQFAQIYPSIRKLTFFTYAHRNEIDIIMRLENLTYLSISCDFQDLLEILDITGNQLQTLIFGYNRNDPHVMDGDLVNEKCPNLKTLEISCSACIYKGMAPFKHVEVFKIEATTSEERFWYSSAILLITRMPALTHLILGHFFSRNMSAAWIKKAVSRKCFQSIKTLTIGYCPLLSTRDVKMWLSSCQNLRKFKYEPRIGQVDWEEIKDSFESPHLIFCGVYE